MHLSNGFKQFSRFAAGGTVPTYAPGPVIVQAPIDYDRLAQAMQKVNIYTKTQEVMASMENIRYTQQQQNQ